MSQDIELCKKLPQKTNLGNLPDVIINLGSISHFLFFVFFYLTGFVVVVAVMYKSPQIWFSSKQDINSK